MKPSLEDFLKCKKVRCVDVDGDATLITTGKVYDVIGLDENYVHVIDDNGDKAKYLYCRFEPVLDSAENPLQEMKLTPEVQAVEPVLADNSINIQDIGTDILDTNANIKDTSKFKVGDKVYYRAYADICVVSDVSDLGEVQIKGWGEDYYNSRYFCHATQGNYEMLCKLYPHIEFEQPPKELTGIELAKKLIAKGHNYLVVDTVIGIRVLTRLEGNTLIDYNNVRLDELDDITPLDDITGEPLNESILND